MSTSRAELSGTRLNCLGSVSTLSKLSATTLENCRLALQPQLDLQREEQPRANCCVAARSVLDPRIT